MILFFGYYVTTGFPGNNDFSHNPHFTESAISTLANSFAIKQQVNTSLIFGDFIAALKAITGIFIGAPISDALSGLPFIDTSILFLIQIIYGSANLALWCYIIANRSI
jgi:predicted membrane-bound spermidine synthase